MTGIETNFQLKSWKSQILHIASELTMACAHMPDSPRRDRMIEAMTQLGRVADKLDFARAIAGPDELKILLKLSVEEYREQKQCQHVGGDVANFPTVANFTTSQSVKSVQTETADSAKVSRFPKPQRTQDQFGE